MARLAPGCATCGTWTITLHTSTMITGFTTTAGAECYDPDRRAWDLE